MSFINRMLVWWWPFSVETRCYNRKD